MFTVYCHINKINGKRYVGITSREVKKRWLNGKGYQGNHHFNNAIKKYGWVYYHCANKCKFENKKWEYAKEENE